ncbi:hypothetical protein KL927_003346 [Ogataea polymorpha]|nr:hypothetical protein KL927_003346 [Ogataea polymorpha]
MIDIRVSERAPKSCVQCSRRHVKCDKKQPCSACIRRKVADACTREMVVVNGRLVNEPEMQKLVDANSQLTRKLADAEAEIRFLRKNLGVAPTISLDGLPSENMAKKPDAPVDDGSIEYLTRGLGLSQSNDENLQLCLGNPEMWRSKPKTGPNYDVNFYSSASYDAKKKLVSELLGQITPEVCLETVTFSLTPPPRHPPPSLFFPPL